MMRGYQANLERRVDEVVRGVIIEQDETSGVVRAETDIGHESYTTNSWSLLPTSTYLVVIYGHNAILCMMIDDNVLYLPGCLGSHCG